LIVNTVVAQLVRASDS